MNHDECDVCGKEFIPGISGWIIIHPESGFVPMPMERYCSEACQNAEGIRDITGKFHSFKSGD